MCLYTQTLHACGHPRYTLKVSCSKYYYNPLTNAPACALITSSAGCPPKACIAETVMHAFFTCGQDDCTYTPDSDPFLDHSVEVRVFPRAPKLGSTVWNVPLAGQRDGEDSEMGGMYEMGGTYKMIKAYEPATRGFAAPVDTASFYARPRGKMRGRTGERAPTQTPSEGIRKVLKNDRRTRGGRRGARQRAQRK